MKAIWLGALALLLMTLVPIPAEAKVAGACTITVQGQDLGGDAVTTIAAPADGNLTYSIVAAIPVVRWSVTLHYGPFERIVLDRPFEAGATTETGVFDVSQYTKYGTGLYQVTGQATLQDGSICTGTMNLKVEGSPFRTVLGLAAVAILGAAGVGILLTILQIVFDAKDVVEGAKDFIEQARHTKAAAAVGASATAGDVGPSPGEAGPDRPPNNP